MIHTPVMLDEVIEYLNIKPGAKIIDATLDGGGHSAAILERTGFTGKVLGIEIDPELILAAKLKIKNEKLKNLVVVNDNYTNLKKIVTEYGFYPDGILFDLGVSFWHYEKSGRGFSFMRDELLDMRFNTKIETKTAADIVNTASREELEDILASYGEEKFASEISKNIVNFRKIKPVVKTSELAEIINNSVPGWYRHKKINPATKTFQALRIAVNDELDNVARGINAAVDVVNSGGRIVVISFHGLEDKIVREVFKRKAKEGIIRWVVKGTVKPKWEETKNNPRARSAKMKIVEKV